MTVLAGCSLLVIAAIFSAVWYWLAQRRNRGRALQVLRWLEVAVGTQAEATGITWINPSRFKVPLRLRCGLFHRAWVIVNFMPCELPLRWLAHKLSGTRESLVFCADLDLPPTFSLHVHNFRWCARSSRSAEPRSSGAERCGRFVLTTRLDWQREVSAAMASLSRGENHEFLEINFQRRTPHFSAKLPLEVIAPESPVRGCMFDTMREVAASASASLS